MMPPTYLLICIVIMVALHFLLPVRRIISWPYNCLGVLPLLSGIAVSWWASNLFNKAETTVKPFEQSNHLVTEGPYRFSRHPMYVGMALVPVGLAILLGTITPVLPVPAFVWIMAKKFVVPEEKAMEETFGDAWLEYARRVRRWF